MSFEHQPSFKFQPSPRRTWLCTVEFDLRLLNFVLNLASLRAQELPNGAKSWMWLCSPLGAPAHDNDDEYAILVWSHWLHRLNLSA